MTLSIRTRRARADWVYGYLLDDDPTQAVSDEDNGSQLCLVILFSLVVEMYQEHIRIIANTSCAR